ncbi:cation:proton antiporter [Salipiger aestuarii]|uniref:Multisubunit potassium/proton antiporter PhaD subunit n=1 Tax=Salipiger aestuarii TaxID=568098 RepID=A0A327XWX1_9RHOB|nr:monovalent cation/H+ antiporter subunit D [Salipiger aestuarii]KAA8606222.1 cation:proton antiporter [Salipiger aestuarii]KAB2540887.1 cation:proton antiporter [Salipiger aestuarii]RAK12406.1 multisubunit potassium/proton antiporter PhaD subunit [Salipiger aestuarii]
MNHWILAPVVLPAMVAPMLAYVMRHDVVLQRVVSIAASAVLAAIALGLFTIAADGTVHVYRLGDWPAPFGIVLVLDRLSALLILLTAVLGGVVLVHASATGWDRKGRHFHALMQFQLMGICGAFLTGDAFNLFVLFEILLIASYGLAVHGGGKARLKAGLQYVIMNLAGSALFLIALGTVYASTGTLNIADLSQKVREIPLEDAALVRVAAMLMMIVFAVKAALFPMQFWLPGTYAQSPAPVAALFAIMTKVGAYAILRMHTMVFGPDADAIGTLSGDWLMPAAMITVAVGALGVMGARRLAPLVAFATLGSTATLMLAVAGFAPDATGAALYYLVHSTLAAATLFLVIDLVLTRRAGDELSAQPATAQNGLLAALFFGAAIAVAGMPPLSGFLGKLLVLDALGNHPLAAWIWALVLGGSLLTIVGFARAGSVLFWKSTTPGLALPDDPAPEDPAPAPVTPAQAAPAIATLAALGLLTVFAGPLMRYTQATAAQLYDPAPYVNAVLVDQPGTKDLPEEDH